VKIELNGERQSVREGATVAEVVQLAGAESTRGVAVAVDAEVVPRSVWESTRLFEGQRVEVLRAVQGG
jgi:sulfur carrier protein